MPRLIRHNWSSPFKLRLGYETMIFTSYNRLEQRRALRTVPTLEISIDWVDVASNAMKVITQPTQYFFIPFEPEAFLGTRGLAGTKKVTIANDITNYFLLKNVTPLYICDADGNYVKISSMAGNEIILESDLAGTSSEMFPCLKTITKNIQQSFLTSKIVSTNFVFEHVRE